MHSIIVSLVLMMALYLSLFGITRLVHGAVLVTKGISPTDHGLMSLSLAYGVPALAWSLFYWLTH